MVLIELIGDHSVDERLHVYRVDFPSATTDPPTTSLLLEREIRDWRQGVRASWRLGSGLLLYHPKDEGDIFVIEDVLDVDGTQRIEIPKSELEVSRATYNELNQRHSRSRSGIRVPSRHAIHSIDMCRA